MIHAINDEISAYSGEDPPRWAESHRIGGVTELAVLAPVKRGLVPGELRSYEERLRATIANLAGRHARGMPIELDRVSTIHFGRMIILRPEQLGASDIGQHIGGRGQSRPAPTFDEYEEIGDEPLSSAAKSQGDTTPQASMGEAARPAMLLILVEFDGELKPYMREIAQFLNTDFDTIFENCQHYPGTADFDIFWRWIRTFQITTDLFYATYPDLSVVRIKQLEMFKRRFDAFVARVRSPTGERPDSMDELFDDFLRAEQQKAFGFPYPGGTYANADESEGD